MKWSLFSRAGFIVIFTLSSSCAAANTASVSYLLERISGSQYRLDYSLSNSSSSSKNIYYVKVMFPAGLFKKISRSSPYGWGLGGLYPSSSETIGYSSWYTTVAGYRLTPADTLTGFGVTFEYLGQEPFSLGGLGQEFEARFKTDADPELYQGRTMPGQPGPAPVPEPATLLLLGSGLLGLGFFRRKKCCFDG